MNLRIERVLPSDDIACTFIASEYLKMLIELNPINMSVYNEERLAKMFIDDYIEKYIDSGSLIYAAYINEEIVGALKLDDGEHLSCLFVKQEYRRQLIGSKLLERLISECKNTKIITVDARIDCISLYERFSFKRTSFDVNRTFIPMELEMKKHGK